MYNSNWISSVSVATVLLASFVGVASTTAFADTRADTARTTGVWTVESGDTLWGIARELFPGEASTQATLRTNLMELNREAFAGGLPEGLKVDARLSLPDFALQRTVSVTATAPVARQVGEQPLTAEVPAELPKTNEVPAAAGAPAKVKTPVAEVASEPELDFVGKVLFARGQMTAQQDGGETRALARNSAIYQGDKITTPARGFGQLQLTDGALLAIRPSSQLAIEQFNFDGNQDGNESSVLRLIRGGFRTITGAVGKVNKDKYRVNTVIATVGIRGTHYGLRLCDPACELPNGETVSGLFGGAVDGTITVDNDSGESEFGNDEYFLVNNRVDLPIGMLAPPGVIFDGGETTTDMVLSEDEKRALEEDSDNVLSNSHAESALIASAIPTAVEVLVRNENNLQAGVKEREIDDEPVDEPVDEPGPPDEPFIHPLPTKPDIDLPLPEGATVLLSYVTEDSDKKLSPLSISIPSLGGGDLVVDAIIGTVDGKDNVVVFAEGFDENGSASCNPCQFSNHTATLNDSGTVLDVNWGRWDTAPDSVWAASNTGEAVAAVSSAHFAYIEQASTAESFPRSGTLSYSHIVGGTKPTDLNGAVGTLESVDVGVNFDSATITNYDLELKFGDGTMVSAGLDEQPETATLRDVVSGQLLDLAGNCSMGQCGNPILLDGGAALAFVDDDDDVKTPPAAAVSTFALTADDPSNGDIGFAGSFVATPAVE